MPQSVCYFHDFDLDERGWRNTHPEISCRACRSDGYFSKEQINKYFAAHFRFTAIYTRRVGYPEQLNVIMLPNDRLYEAERIAPRGGGFHLDEIVFTDPYVHLGNNTITLIKPPSGKTLQDIREKWDHGSRHKNEIENDLIRKPIAYIVDATQAIIESIGLEKEKLNRLTMAKTKALIYDRLISMGFDAMLVKKSKNKSSGVVLVFYSNNQYLVPFLGVLEIKNLQKNHTPVASKNFKLDEFWKPHFRIGLIITNTTFKVDSDWLAENKTAIENIKDMHGLRFWINSECLKDLKWTEIPENLELIPGIKTSLTMSNLILSS